MEITLNDLPLETLAYIFSFIFPPSSIPRIVCKNWLKALKNLPWYGKAEVSSYFAKKVDDKDVDRKFLSVSDMNDVFRGAYFNKYLKHLIFKYFNLRPLPLRVPFRLYPHQCEAINFMRERENMDISSAQGVRGGIIMMTMGLGKSLTSVAYSLISPRKKYLSEKHGKNGYPTLIISSKMVMGEWKSEVFKKFFGSRVKVLYLHEQYMKTEEINSLTRKKIVKYDFVITTYDVCVKICKKREFFQRALKRGASNTLQSGKVISINTAKRIQADKPYYKGLAIIYGTPWERIICDESTRFANWKTMTYRCIMAIYGKYKWCLTGTPVRNTSVDLWSQLRFCGYLGTDKAKDWKKKGKMYMKDHDLSGTIFNIDYERANITLPQKKIHNHQVEFSHDEKNVYDYISGKVKEAYRNMLMGTVTFASVLALFTRLRQLCVAPYLLSPDSKRKSGTNTLELVHEVETYVKNKYGSGGIFSAKMSKLREILQSIPKNEKVLVFSSFVSCLDLLAEVCQEYIPNYDLVQIDGDTKGDERIELIQEFKTNDRIRALFITYKVGSEGLNLIRANHVICVEPWWTPSVHDQAAARAWRFGQMRNVHVHLVYMKDSIEDRILEICQEKREITKMFLDGTKKEISSIGLDKKTMGRILGM